MNNGRHITDQSGKYQNSWRKRKLQILGNVKSGHLQANWNEIKSKKGVPQKTFSKPNSESDPE